MTLTCNSYVTPLSPHSTADTNDGGVSQGVSELRVRLVKRNYVPRLCII